MEAKTMTITEALVDLKQTDKKITDKMSVLPLGVVTSKKNPTIPGGFKTQDEYRNAIRSSLQQVNDLIEYRNKLKASIVASNATTSVQVGKRTMTVAEAIERKNSIAYTKTLQSRLNTAIENTQQKVERENQGLSNKADSHLAQFPNMEPEQLRSMREAFLENNTVYFLTDDNVYKMNEKLEKEIDDFVNNVDVALSVSNATTEITVK